ncbi:MAG: EscU/YscU/HrcU family type III secretion system export apparatus switch protein [Sphingomonadaceae bacterium]|nr:EscU/YscU/HrcU family type III secretion system export apparatus switch protein [Sphingomonadaceae bacterium]
MAESAGERTEAPTPKRRREAAERGDRPNLADLGPALTTIVGGVWLLAGGGTLADRLGAVLRGALTFRHSPGTEFDPGGAALRLALGIAPALAVVLAATAFASIAAGLAAGGWRFNAASLAPKWSRINPAAGLARMFGRQALGGLAKALLKIASVGAAAALALAGLVPYAAALAAADPGPATMLAAARIAGVLIATGAALGIVAAISTPFALLAWLKRLRMTRQELLDEHKEQEGNPEARAARRRRQREQARAGVRPALAQANVVITNPTHFAVALRYDRERDRAPVAVARARGDAALAIRDAARDLGLPVIDHPELARALYFTTRRDREIAPELYAAAATVLAWVFSLERAGARRPAPQPPVPNSLRFDENGRPLA